jgi:hypothetical protein
VRWREVAPRTPQATFRLPSPRRRGRPSALEDADEVLIADPLELTDRQAARLLVRLSGDLFDEILIEVDDVGELGAHRAADRGSWGGQCADHGHRL